MTTKSFSKEMELFFHCVKGTEKWWKSGGRSAVNYFRHQISLNQLIPNTNTHLIFTQAIEGFVWKSQSQHPCPSQNPRKKPDDPPPWRFFYFESCCLHLWKPQVKCMNRKVNNVPSFHPVTVYIAPVMRVSNYRLYVPLIKVGSTPYNNS